MVAAGPPAAAAVNQASQSDLVHGCSWNFRFSDRSWRYCIPQRIPEVHRSNSSSCFLDGWQDLDSHSAEMGADVSSFELWQKSFAMAPYLKYLDISWNDHLCRPWFCYVLLQTAWFWLSNFAPLDQMTPFPFQRSPRRHQMTIRQSEAKVSWSIRYFSLQFQDVSG